MIVIASKAKQSISLQRYIGLLRRLILLVMTG